MDSFSRGGGKSTGTKEALIAQAQSSGPFKKYAYVTGRFTINIKARYISNDRFDFILECERNDSYTAVLAVKKGAEFRKVFEELCDAGEKHWRENHS